MQSEQPLGKLLSGTSKAEVRVVANADKLLGNPIIRTSKAGTKAEQEKKGDAAAAGSGRKTQLILPEPDSVYTKADPYDMDVVDIGGKVCVCARVCARAGLLLPSSSLLLSSFRSLSLSLSFPLTLPLPDLFSRSLLRSPTRPLSHLCTRTNACRVSPGPTKKARLAMPS